MQALPIVLSPLDAPDEKVVSMVVEASHEPAIQTMNYLPDCMDTAQARDYCAKSDGVVLWEGGVPVGVTVVDHHPNPGEGVVLPAGCVELDEWVLPPHRGKGILGRRGWPVIAAWLAERFSHVVSVTWDHNAHAKALLLGRGYKSIGVTRWSGNGTEGVCEVFLYDLAPHKIGAARRSDA